MTSYSFLPPQENRVNEAFMAAFTLPSEQTIAALEQLQPRIQDLSWDAQHNIQSQALNCAALYDNSAAYEYFLFNKFYELQYNLKAIKYSFSSLSGFKDTSFIQQIFEVWPLSIKNNPILYRDFCEDLLVNCSPDSQGQEMSAFVYMLKYVKHLYEKEGKKFDILANPDFLGIQAFWTTRNLAAFEVLIHTLELTGEEPQLKRFLNFKPEGATEGGRTMGQASWAQPIQEWLNAHRERKLLSIQTPDLVLSGKSTRQNRI